MREIFAAAALALLAPGESGAQQGAPTSNEEIVVTGQRTEEAIHAFVSQMSISPRSENQLGRWDRRICPGVAGLRTRYAQFVIDRIAQRALDVGLDTGEPGCRANILIVVSPNPGAIAHELVSNNRGRMGYFYERGRRSLGRRALAAFETSTAPVRWWHVNHTVTRDGEVIGEVVDKGQLGEIAAPVVNLSGGSSRLSRTTHQDFGVAFIVVDARQLTSIDFDFGALADYLAMVSLAQLDPEADTSSFPTILNLFAARPRGETLTAMSDWDIAYLRGLYGATRDAATAQRQEGEIARSMDRDLTPQ